MVSMLSEKPIYAPPRLSEVSAPALPLMKRFHCVFSREAEGCYARVARPVLAHAFHEAATELERFLAQWEPRISGGGGGAGKKG